VGDAEGHMANAKSLEAEAEASVATQRIAKLTQGQEVALGDFHRGD